MSPASHVSSPLGDPRQASLGLDPPVSKMGTLLGLPEEPAGDADGHVSRLGAGGGAVGVGVRRGHRGSGSREQPQGAVRAPVTPGGAELACVSSRPPVGPRTLPWASEQLSVDVSSSARRSGPPGPPRVPPSLSAVSVLRGVIWASALFDLHIDCPRVLSWSPSGPSPPLVWDPCGRCSPSNPLSPPNI